MPDSSPLLHCLEQVNDDVWEVLLPKLVSQGSAAAVAETCSQLRRLCQHSVRSLNMTNFPASSINTDVLMGHAAAVAEHFPNCSQLVLESGSRMSYWQLPVVLPLLGRLPKLSEATLTVAADEGPLPTAMLLGSMRTALTGLQGWTMQVQQSWAGAPFCWARLAEFTQLKKLHVEFASNVPRPYNCKDLSVLGSLSSLRQLKLLSPAYFGGQQVAPEQQQAGVYSWLGSMSVLTCLELSVPTASGLASIGKCTDLRSLSLLPVPDMPITLEPEAFEAIGQLGKLTLLDLYDGIEGTQTAPCAGALEQLMCLESVGAELWSADVLDAFSKLPHLAVVRGGWRASAAEQQCGTVCTQVTCLDFVRGDVPFQAFPNLRKLTQSSTMSLAAFTGLPQHCPNLQEFWVGAAKTEDGMDFSLDLVPEEASIPAILSLSQLVHLSVLGWKPFLGTEVAALVTVAEALSDLKLRQVGVVFESACRLPLVSLTPLGRLTKLEQLQVMLCADIDVIDEDMEALLSALCRVRSVEFAIADVELLDAFQVTRDNLQRMRLPLPEQLVLKSA